MLFQNHRLARYAALIALLAYVGCDTASLPTEDAQETVTNELRSGDVIPGHYIVVLTAQTLNKTAVLGELTALEGVDAEHTYETALHGFAGAISDETLSQLRNDPRVDYIEPDRVVSFAPPWCTPDSTHPACDDGGDDGGGNPEEVTPWGITRVGGGESGAGKTAWVIDTGIDLDHPDLNVDAGRSRTFITRGKDSKSADDGNGHGTHVAGTIAAIDNDRDVIGVAAGATVVAVKVLSSSGSGSYSGVIAGVDYVAANAANGDVANMSLGGPPSSAVDTAVENAAAGGIYFALAAGNESQHANNSSPARANGSNIYTVSAIGQNDCLASFSNYGNPPVDYAAPGVGVLSTYKNGGTATLNGTSMASPHVAGLLLLGNVGSDGTACGDPDGDPDPIAHR